MKKEMAIFISLGIIVIAAGAAVSYLFLFRRANPPLLPGTVRIGSAIFNVEIASTTLERTRGLSFRESLGEDQGMLFIFELPAVQHFWMKDMHFSLDIIWIGGDKVLGFAQNAAPQPGVSPWGLTVYDSPDGTDKVLEVNAGTVLKDNIHVGDSVQIGGEQGAGG